MDDERMNLVFGRTVDQDTQDLTDADTRAALVGATFDAGADVLSRASHEAVAYQLLFDDPPATWATATRLAALGLTREQILTQITAAFSPHLLAALERGEAVDAAAYRDALDALPQPTEVEIETALLAAVRDQPGIAIESAVEQTIAALVGSANATDRLRTTVEHIVDDASANWGPLVVAGAGLVEVASSLAGKVFTHRLTASEVERGRIDAGFDLWIHRRRSDLHDGEDQVDLTSPDDGPLGWAFGGDWRQAGSDGAVVSVRVSIDGSVEATVIDDPGPPDPALVAALRATYDRDVDEFDLPVTSEELIATMLLEGSWFDEPGAPLSEVAEAAGLEVRGIEVADDERVWHNAAVFAREMRVFRRLPSNHQDAEKVLSVLEQADGLASARAPAAGDGDDADRSAWRHVWRVLDDLERLSVVTEELFHPPATGLGQIDPQPFVDAALAAATHDHERAIALWLKSFVAEGRGDLDGAEAALSEALAADRTYLPAVDRLAWYASDRGDAAKAAHLWRSLEDNQAVAGDLDFVSAALDQAHDLGRNDPCWCGSGRKFKQCHLGQTEVAPLAARVPWLAHKASAFVERRGGQERSDVVDVAIARAVDPAEDASVAMAYADPLVMDLVLTEGGWFEQFLAERGSILPADEADLAASWVGVARTVYEVEAVDADVVTMRDLRSDERLDVSDPVFARLARPAALVCGRAVPDGSSHQFIGGPFEVARGRESELLAVLDDAHARHDALIVAEWVAASERSRAMQET